MADDKDSWRNKEEEDDEEELDASNYIAQKDAVLFAIDVSESMLAAPPKSEDRKAEKDSPTAAAIKCAYEIMRQRIISSPKDMMGVLLFGTEQTKFQEEDAGSRGTLPFPHCYLLCDLNVPAAEDVKALKAIVEDEEESEKLLVPTDEPVSMSNMLFCANQIFTTRAPNFGSRRLFIITDKDDPHSTDKNSRSQASVRAKDLYDLGVVIELFPISHLDHEFDRTKFYDDIIYRDPAGEVELANAPSNFKSFSGDGISLLSNLISDINSKQVAKRSLFAELPFEIGPGFKITVKGYNLLQKQAPARSCFVYVNDEVAQIPTLVSNIHSEATDKEVQKVEIKKAYKFGGSQVYFTPEEQKELKNFGSPVLRIIGFKPQSVLPFWASMKKSTYIYPSEESYVGSTRVFSALWQKLLKDKKMAVAWYIARVNASPLLVAILPSSENIDETTGQQTIPAGLWLYTLPFADDVREPPPLPKPLVAPDNLVDEMRKVVQQLQLPKAAYDPTKYPNPSLQWHYKVIQAMALEEEYPENADDKTIPKFRQINKRAGAFINEWGVILDNQITKYQNSRREFTTIKRASEGPEPAKKKIKAEKEKHSFEDMSIDALKRLHEKDVIGKYTIADLKNFCYVKGLSTGGKKADLVERVEGWIEEQN